MKLIAISDTHGQHGQLSLPEADVIIHAGDVSKRGMPHEVSDFLYWFAALDYKYKIFIAGNHDFLFERLPASEVNALIPENVIYLNDSGIEIEGIKFWGSPVQPWFHNWAFNRQRGADIKGHWDVIPDGTDVLITHGPARGILDRTLYGDKVGCEDLLNAITRVRPAVHICGHIHEAYGVIRESGTTFINASVLNQDYRMTNLPVEHLL